jgi:hypothetical protein
MNSTQEELARKLLYLMHLAFVEARALAQCTNNRQLEDLADTFEILPRFVEKCDQAGMESIRSALKKYQESYPHSPYNFLSRFENGHVPDRY